jgi:SAM-dependent methyltransferase
MDKEWHGNVANHAVLYDLLHQDRGPDIDMYGRLTDGCSRVLECGIGTGRVAIPLARKGRVVYGIDTSSEMLDRLRLKLLSESEDVACRIRAHTDDMRSFDLGLEFQFCYIPFMTFNYLASIEEQLACLDRMRAHLEVRGTLVIELMSYHREWFYDDGVARLVLRQAMPDGKGSVEISRVTRFDASTQTVEHDRHYRFLDPDGRVESEQVVLLRNRFFLLGEAMMLLRGSRLSIRSVWGDHAGGEYTQKSQVMILVAERVE